MVSPSILKMCSVLLLALALTFSRALHDAGKLRNPEIIQCKWKPNENPTDERVSYLGAQLWKATVDTKQKLNLVDILEKAGDIQNWGLNDAVYYDIFVELRYLKTVSRLFYDNKMKYIVACDNYQRWINEENPPTNENHSGHNLTWVKYHRLADIESFIDYLGVTYPSLCSIKTIGTSIEGRPLRVLKLSNGRAQNKAIWIDGGMHGREWISVATVTYAIRRLVENWENESDAVRNIDWHFLPVFNPDGYEFTHTHDRLWRKNRRRNGTCSGTDLNRNFGTFWGGAGASKCPCHDVYGGTEPYSEPETKAVNNYITVAEKETPWKTFITFHSYGQDIIHAKGDDLKIISDKIAAEMQSVYGTPYKVESDPASGASDEWAKQISGMKYVATIELRDMGKYGFALPAFNIKPSGEESMAALRLIAYIINAL